MYINKKEFGSEYAGLLFVLVFCVLYGLCASGGRVCDVLCCVCEIACLFICNCSVILKEDRRWKIGTYLIRRGVRTERSSIDTHCWALQRIQQRYMYVCCVTNGARCMTTCCHGQPTNLHDCSRRLTRHITTQRRGLRLLWWWDPQSSWSPVPCVCVYTLHNSFTSTPPSISLYADCGTFCKKYMLFHTSSWLKYAKTLCVYNVRYDNITIVATYLYMYHYTGSYNMETSSQESAPASSTKRKQYHHDTTVDSAATCASIREKLGKIMSAKKDGVKIKSDGGMQTLVSEICLAFADLKAANREAQMENEHKKSEVSTWGKEEKDMIADNDNRSRRRNSS